MRAGEVTFEVQSALSFELGALNDGRLLERIAGNERFSIQRPNGLRQLEIRTQGSKVEVRLIATKERDGIAQEVRLITQPAACLAVWLKLEDGTERSFASPFQYASAAPRRCLSRAA